MESNKSHLFFTIIIPVYCGKSHNLERCLESIWKQILDTNLYEIICVDDCSPDNTLEWLKEEATKHPNLKVLVNEKNRRQGGGRNHGIEEAKGKYVMFIDQDDYYHPGSLIKVYKHLSNNDLDILVNDSAYQFEGHESNKLQLCLPYREVTDIETFVSKNGWTIAPWRLTINLEYYRKHNFKFPENCRIEDVDWAVNVLYYAKRIQYLSHILVHYNKAETGTTDNMYRDASILRDNTIAGNRTLNIADTIYKNSPLKPKVYQLCSTYYNFSVKYMLGLLASISTKKQILKIIPQITTNSSLVNFAIKHPTFYAIMSNLTVPAFRALRTVHRKRSAKKFKS